MSKLHIHISELRNKHDKRVNRDGGGKKGGIKTHVFACATPKDHCGGKHNAKVDAVVHGSLQDAQQCINKWARIRKEEE